MEPFRSSKASRPELTYALACKWGPVFGAPVSSIMAIVDIESRHEPNKTCFIREDKDGAWGLGQQMLDEARWKLKTIVDTYGDISSEVVRVSKKFRDTGKSLLDPDLNIMMTAWQLGRLHKAFRDFSTVAAAYQQGEGAVRARMAAGKPPVSKDQPRGLYYAATAVSVQYRYMQSPLIIDTLDTVDVLPSVAPPLPSLGYTP